MNREFSISDSESIKFGEDTLQWSLDDEMLNDIRHGRDLVKFNVVNVSILDLLFDYDLTEDEGTQIRDYLWCYLFRLEQR